MNAAMLYMEVAIKCSTEIKYDSTFVAYLTSEWGKTSLSNNNTTPFKGSIDS